MATSKRVSEAVARPVRTLGQGAVALTFTEFIDQFIVDLSEGQYGALVALLTLVFAWVQVVLENAGGWALLRGTKSVPTPGKELS